MQSIFSILFIIFSYAGNAAQVGTTLDFDSLFPNISDAAQDLEATLEKKQGGKPLTPEELRNIPAKLTEKLTIARNTAILNVRRACYEKISAVCGHYEGFSDDNRTCIMAHRPTFSARCNTALTDNIGEKLMATTLINGLSIPEGSTLIYDAKHTIIGAHSPIRNSYNDIIFKSGEIRFAKGVVTYGKLPEDTLIQGILFKGRDNNGMLFHPNGMVKRGMLAQDTTYHGLMLTSDTVIQLHPNGFFQSGVLAKDTTIGERTYKAGSYLYANEKGELSDDHAILLKHTQRQKAPETQP